MAGAAPAKKTQKEVEARHGIWLNDAGTLSFGKGMEGELLIEEANYADLKAKNKEERIKNFNDTKNPPPPPVETPAPASVIEEVIKEADAAAVPAKTEEASPVQG